RLLTQFAIVALPLGWPVRRRNLHRSYLVFGAVGCPVGEVGGYHIRLRRRVVEGSVHYPRGDTISDQYAEARLTGAARKLGEIAGLEAPVFCVGRMHFQQIFVMPDNVAGAPSLRA